MFQHLINEGSVVAVILMTYSSGVMNDVIFNKHDIPSTPLIKLINLLSAPCIIWASVYIGLFEGFFLGVLGFLVISILGGAITAIIRSNAHLFPFFYFSTILTSGLGYYMSISTLTH